MLEFKTYNNLLTEDKSRFVKKNPNLTNRHKRVVIQWLKDHQHAEREFLRKNGNDPMIFARMSVEEWNDFMDNAENTKTQKKKKEKALRHKGISGLKENKDYVHMRLKNKYFLAYIPLNPQASKVIMSTHVGECSHQGCIGSSQADHYFWAEGAQKGMVAIIVIGNEQKYAVMMKKNNKSWDIWYHTNIPTDVRHDEGIPNFSIKKELVGSKQSKLYDEIRGMWVSEQGKEDAIRAYDDLANDIERYIKDYAEALEYGESEIERILDDTITNYEEKIADMWEQFKKDKAENRYKMKYSEIEKRQNMKDRIEALKYVLKNNPQGTDVDRDGNPVWYIGGVEQSARVRTRRIDPRMSVAGAGETGVPYTKKELERYIKFAEKEWLKDLPKNGEADEDGIKQEEERIKELTKHLQYYIDKMKEVKKKDETWMLYSERHYGDSDWKWVDEVDWSDWIPSHDMEWAEDVHEPWLQSDMYKPYSDYNEAMGSGERLDDDYHLEESIREHAYSGDTNIDGYEVLVDHGFEHPDNIGE